MCQGFFLDNRPYAEAVVTSSTFTANNALLFLIDTGADKTSIGGRDARRLGIDVSTLSNHKQIGGVGGSVEAYPIKDILMK